MKNNDAVKILQQGLSGLGIGNSVNEFFMQIDDSVIYEMIGVAFVAQLKDMPKDKLKEVIRKLKMATDEEGVIVA